MPFIDLQNISVFGINVYDKNRKLWNILLGRHLTKFQILKNISLHIKANERIGFIGKNGSGKSSLLKVITGIYPPQEGKVTVNGQVTSILEAGAGISAFLSGYDALRMGFVYNNIVDQYSKKLAEEILKFAGIEKKFWVLPFSQYSSGMQSRVVTSMALFQKGEILIYDEISSTTTDAGFSARAKVMMQEKWKNATIGLFVSHSAIEMERMCDNCYLLENGSIVNYGPVKTILAEYKKTL